jgi:protein phosphatase
MAQGGACAPAKHRGIRPGLRVVAQGAALAGDLGLLPPAHVDPDNGYRFYAPAQLERARLVAWLRRIGMPLATIQSVITLPPAAAAMEVAFYLEKIEAEAAAKRRLGSFLIAYLSGKDATMTEPAGEPLTIRYAVRTDIGLVREGNEDSAYAGARLLAVADGMGGHAHGEVASAAVIDAMKPLDVAVSSGELLNALDHAVRRADGTLREMQAADPSLRGMGTTLTALLWSGDQLGLVHIGDSRAYLVRDQEVFQITHDHTLVQSLLDDGKITEEEAASHPKRALLLRALDGQHDFEPDLEVIQARAGDRYMLSSDGLHGVVTPAGIARVLLTVQDPDQAAADLIKLALDGGGPDNITVIVADVAAAPGEPGEQRP